MADTIEVLLVGESHEQRQNLKKLIGARHGVEVIGEAPNGQEALQRLLRLTPSILLVIVPEDVEESVRELERLTLQHPQIGVVALSEHRDWHYVRQYMRAGARDYLYMPVTADLLLQTIQEVHRVDQELYKRSAKAVLTDEYTHEVDVIAFVSSKGGVGKTTLAVNTAVELAVRGKETVLIDLDLQSGIDHLLLNLSPSHTIADLTTEMTDIDPELIERYMVRHDSGLKVLCAPRLPEEMELVRPEHVNVIVQSLQKKYDYVVIDTAPVVNDILLTALELSDTVLVVNTLNLAVLKSNKALIRLFCELGYDSTKLKHVINRSSVKTGVTVSDVKQTFDSDVFWEMDDDYRFVETASNEGIPFVSASKMNKLSRQVQTLVQKIVGEEQRTAARRTGLKRRSAVRG